MSVATNELERAFLEDGYVVAPSSDPEALARIRGVVANAVATYLGETPTPDHGTYLDRAGQRLTPANVNDVRLAVIAAIEKTPWFREAYFSCGSDTIERLVGNELAMQRSVGFSIQLPNDASSVLPLHADTWSEDSAFEAVLWIPLVDVARTKSMFILPRAKHRLWHDRLPEFAERGVEGLFDAVRGDVEFLDIAYGQVLVFSHTLMHGNRRNEESLARWSLNVRFKGLFTPYADKRLGDFFEPFRVRALTRIALDYEEPGGFHE